MKQYTGILMVGLATLVAAPAMAQTAGYSDVPATHWAADSISQLNTRKIMVAQKPAAGKKPVYDGSKPVTRYELAVTLYRFVQYVERSDKQKKSKSGAFLPANPKDGAEAIKTLVAKGYLPKNTPLLKEGNKAVTGNELADALASVLVKAKEKTIPITKESEMDKQIDNPIHGTPGT